MEGMQEFKIEYLGKGTQTFKGPGYDYFFTEGTVVPTRVIIAATRAAKYPELFAVYDAQGNRFKVKNARRILGQMRRERQEIARAARKKEKDRKAAASEARSRRKSGIENPPRLQSERIQVDVDEVLNADGKVGEQPPPDIPPDGKPTPFACGFCDQTFKSRAGLNSHTRFKHHEEPNDGDSLKP